MKMEDHENSQFEISIYFMKFAFNFLSTTDKIGFCSRVDFSFKRDISDTMSMYFKNAFILFE